MIAEMFSIEINQGKLFILSSFSLTLYILDSEKDLENLKKGVDIIYPIVRNKLPLAAASLDFNKLIIQSLIKLSRTHDIFDEIIKISKFYTDHLSSANIFFLSQFFASTSKQITSSENEQLFFSSLKILLGKIDIKKIPVFGLFLLFFIKPFNRKAVLKLLF